MSTDQPYLQRPGVDERVIVEEMIHSQHHEHWEECYKFVKHCVDMKAKNIPDICMKTLPRRSCTE